MDIGKLFFKIQDFGKILLDPCPTCIPSEINKFTIRQGKTRYDKINRNILYIVVNSTKK